MIWVRASPPTHQLTSVPLEPCYCSKASLLRQSEAAAPDPLPAGSVPTDLLVVLYLNGTGRLLVSR